MYTHIVYAHVYVHRQTDRQTDRKTDRVGYYRAIVMVLCINSLTAALKISGTVIGATGFLGLYGAEHTRFDVTEVGQRQCLLMRDMCRSAISSQSDRIGPKLFHPSKLAWKWRGAPFKSRALYGLAFEGCQVSRTSILFCCRSCSEALLRGLQCCWCVRILLLKEQLHPGASYGTYVSRVLERVSPPTKA